MNRDVLPMEITKIDGIPRVVSDSIIKVIHSRFEADPENPLDTEKVFLATTSTYEQIKHCCYALLTCRLIKASFFPVHQDCGARIGGTEISSFQVENKIRQGQYEGICPNCGKRILPNHVSVGMNFWKLGATIK